MQLHGGLFWRERAYKPGSVLTVIYLGVPLPARSSHPGSSRASLYAPIPVLLRIEFTATVTFTRRRVSSYLAFPPLPRQCKLHILRSAASGWTKSFRRTSFPHKNCVFAGPHCWGCDGAVYLCCTFPEVAFGGRYPLFLPCGARTFLMNRLSPCPRDCPACSHSLLYPTGTGKVNAQFSGRGGSAAFCPAAPPPPAG